MSEIILVEVMLTLLVGRLICDDWKPFEIPCINGLFESVIMIYSLRTKVVTSRYGVYQVVEHLGVGRSACSLLDGEGCQKDCTILMLHHVMI